MLDYLKVFGFGLVIDLAYVLYFLAVTNGRYVRAGLASIMIAAPGLYGFMEVYDNRNLAAPYLFGLFVGTIIGMHFSKWLKGRSLFGNPLE